MAVDGDMKNRRSCCAAAYQTLLKSDYLDRVLRAPCRRTPLLGSFFCAEHRDWAAAAAEPSGTVDVEVLDHKAGEAPVVGVGDADSLLLKVRVLAEPGVYEERWVREVEVDPVIAAAYFARVGLETLRRAADRKFAKIRKEGAVRQFQRQAMADFASIWDAMSAEERAMTMELHSKDMDLEAVRCGTHKESAKERTVHAQTAGVLCACLNSGIIVMIREIFGAESLSQRFFFVGALKERYRELCLCVHDDACHMHKLTAARASSSAHAASIAPPEVLYVGDGFHMAGHTDPWCLTNCHPDAPPFVEQLANFRTSVCEFTFTWLSRFRFQSKHMSELGFKFFLLEMVDAHNTFVCDGITDHLPRATRRDEP